MSPKPADAYGFYDKAVQALNELCALMAEFQCAIAQEDPALQMPPHAVKEAKRALGHFQENFSCMVREQKRKAGR